MSTVVNICYGSNVKSFTCKKPFVPIALKETHEVKEKYSNWIEKITAGLVVVWSYGKLTSSKIALGAELNATPEQLRQNFSKIIDVFTAIAEPILWGFAIVGLVLVATGNKSMGWARVKNVAYAYICINCLPAFFAFLRYISKMLTSAFS